MSDRPPYKLIANYPGPPLVAGDVVFGNGVYVVHRYPPVDVPGIPCSVIQLCYSRVDRGHAQDWRDQQHMKNQLVGMECEGVQLFPAESRLVDSANQFHIWVLADPKQRWPVGYHDGRFVSDTEDHGSTQRPGSGATEEDERRAAAVISQHYLKGGSQ